MKKITITESQYKKLKKNILEGIDWSKNPNGTINMSVNQDMTDKANSGMNSVDTRVFGSKNNVLHGDNTGHWATHSLYQNATSKQAAIQYYTNVVNFVKNGRQGQLDVPENVEPKTVTAVNKWFSEGRSDRWIIDAATKSIARIQQEANPYISTLNRVTSTNSDKVARYTTGTVTGTDVKYIALFTMTDFNFSDAIKHGNVRQNGNIDSILGITKSEREKGDKGTDYANIDVTYDNKYTPDIAQNFSLKNVQDGHYKQQYGLGDDNGYSSVSQFLDKSVNYAAYALKQENYHPDFIVAPPSSSKFNQYYCTNLSNKLGVPFRQDFFIRNLINVKFDNGRDTQAMLEKGFSQKDIMDFENQVKNVAYKEIAYFVSEPIRELVYSNQALFSNISLALHSREKTPINEVFDCLMIYVYRTIINAIQSGNDIVEKHLVHNFMAKQNKLYQKKYDSTHIFTQIVQLINLKIGKKVFNEYMKKTLQLVRQYSNTLKENGYALRFDTKRVKVTQFQKQFRPFLHNVYIIADNYMNNGELMKQYRNAKFLIFDEDINSGATLKLCIDALEEKIPYANEKNIMCLVNAYSAKGW